MRNFEWNIEYQFQIENKHQILLVNEGIIIANRMKELQAQLGNVQQKKTALEQERQKKTKIEQQEKRFVDIMCEHRQIFADEKSNVYGSKNIIDFAETTKIGGFVKFLNDYQEIKTKDSTYSKRIYNKLMTKLNGEKCASSCKCITRNANNTAESVDENSIKEMFYHQTFDRVHVDLFHVYDFGMKKKQVDENERKDATLPYLVQQKMQFFDRDGDVSLFKQNDDKCDVKSDDPVNTCQVLKRLTCAMQYYMSLDVKKK
eukprot:16368_1